MKLELSLSESAKEKLIDDFYLDIQPVDIESKLEDLNAIQMRIHADVFRIKGKGDDIGWIPYLTVSLHYVTRLILKEISSLTILEEIRNRLWQSHSDETLALVVHRMIHILLKLAEDRDTVAEELRNEYKKIQAADEEFEEWDFNSIIDDELSIVQKEYPNYKPGEGAIIYEFAPNEIVDEEAE